MLDSLTSAFMCTLSNLGFAFESLVLLNADNVYFVSSQIPGRLFPIEVRYQPPKIEVSTTHKWLTTPNVGPYLRSRPHIPVFGHFI